ncbi:hypothetical protein D621_18030 [beta proteobacterium AAP51]|nr:hypothetical protein D621_18030 [beta proteobacterium AAP51]
MEDDDNIGFETLQQKSAAHRAARNWPPEVAIALARLQSRIQQRNAADGCSAHCRPAAVQHLRPEDSRLRLALQVLEHF